MSFTYEWPRPALCVDVVVFGLPDADDPLSVLLVQRGLAPYAGWWALPGGFVHIDEALEWAARRELEEEAGIRPLHLEQLGAFGDPGRDPRERVVSVAFFALVRAGEHPARAATDAEDAAWHPLSALPPLAFDHARIVEAALGRLREHADGLVEALMPERFTLSELQRVHEAIAGRALDKRNFRKRVADRLADTGEERADGPHRPARLYSFGRTA